MGGNRLITVFLILTSSEGVDSKFYGEQHFLEDEKKVNGIFSGLKAGYVGDASSLSFFNNQVEDGLFSLIPRFGQEEYRCTGICSCETERKSSLGSTITKGVLFLVAALTKVEAFAFAKEHFEEDCQQRMEELGCETNVISSEVNDCEIILVGDSQRFKFDSEWSLGDGTTNNNDHKKSSSSTSKENYHCEGSCSLNYLFYTSLTFSQMMNRLPKEDYQRLRDEMRETYEAQKDDLPSYPGIDILKMFDELQYWSTELENDVERRARFCERLMLQGSVRSASSSVEAAMNFARDQLHPYCVSESVYGEPKNRREEETYFISGFFGGYFWSLISVVAKESYQIEIPYFSEEQALNFCEGAVENHQTARVILGQVVEAIPVVFSGDNTDANYYEISDLPVKCVRES